MSHGATALLPAHGGNVINQMDAEEDFRITEIDLEEIRRAREQIPALSGRRTDVYNLTERRI